MTKQRTITKKESNPLLRLGLEERYWRCYIEVKNEGEVISSNDLNQFEQSEYDRINGDLEMVFTDPSFRLSRGFWEDIAQQIKKD